MTPFARLYYAMVCKFMHAVLWDLHAMLWKIEMKSLLIWYAMLSMKLEKEAPHTEELEKIQSKLLITKITCNFQCKHLF